MNVDFEPEPSLRSNLSAAWIVFWGLLRGKSLQEVIIEQEDELARMTEEYDRLVAEYNELLESAVREAHDG
jgi:hypothetical protein